MPEAVNQISRPNRLRQWVRALLTCGLPRRFFLTSGPAGESGDRRGSIALTFDDGPHPIYTPAILDRLAHHGAKATFFVVGERAAAHPEVIRRIITEGHAIGHHTYRHDSLGTMSTTALERDIQQTDAVLGKSAGIRSLLFRPPFGKIGARRMLALWRRGMCVVLWNRDPRDYLRTSIQDLRQVLFAEPVCSGDIFLFHDNHPHVVGVLDEFLMEIRNSGMETVPLTAWVGADVIRTEGSEVRTTGLMDAGEPGLVAERPFSQLEQFQEAR